jgi:hypothetical protein
VEIILYKEVLSAIAILLTFAGFIPYIRGILNNTIKPHIFSWIIWGATTFVVFLAQLADKGGAGAWAIGVSACITICIACLAYLKRADISITLLDWFFLVGALASIPAWYLTSDPLWAVVILTIVDLSGFGPTIRKAYTVPRDESLLFFTIFTTRNIVVIMALENYTVTTVLFPAAIAAACLLLIALIIYRRRMLAI